MALTGPTLRVAAVSGAVGWNFGATGPIAEDLASSLGASLAAIGIVTTALLLTHAAAQLPAAGPVESRGPMAVARPALLLATLANAAAALAPGLVWLVLVLAVVGIGTGAAFAAGLEGARRVEDQPALGVIGGVATLGFSVSLQAGALLSDAGAGWPVSFWVCAALSLLAAAVLPADVRGHARGAAGAAAVLSVVRNGAVLRLALLHAATFGSSLVVGAWIVEYLVDGGIHRIAAGTLGLILLGMAIFVRPLGGVLLERGGPWLLIVSGGCVLMAAGYAALALSTALGVALLGAVVAGTGLALPYGGALGGAAIAEPRSPAVAAAFVNLSGAVFALAATPLAGLDLDHGGGTLSFALLAVLGLVAAALNLRPPRAARPERSPRGSATISACASSSSHPRRRRRSASASCSASSATTSSR